MTERAAYNEKALAGRSRVALAQRHPLSGANQILRAAISSCGAAVEGSPGLQPWVAVFAIGAAKRRKEILFGRNSIALDGDLEAKPVIKGEQMHRDVVGAIKARVLIVGNPAPIIKVCAVRELKRMTFMGIT